jgi:BirA family biotin operon repressor/biotin-[acetyl-CoA-carboxylase] ligase
MTIDEMLREKDRMRAKKFLTLSCCSPTLLLGGQPMERILQILKEHQGEYVSGERLAETAGITRAAIWKQINRLREFGYLIESAPRRGYKLLDSTHALYPYELKSGLATKVFGREIDYHEVVDSTNLRAKALARQGAPEGTLVLAEQQTQGRGRLGRVWASRPGLGLWFSLILRPQVGTSELAVITILTAVALARAICQATGIQVQVKWPNDLLYNNAKLVGILAELNGELERVNYLVLGIGLNVNHLPEDFPPELAGRATSLLQIKQASVDRKAVLQCFLAEFEQQYALLGTERLSGVIDYARAHSATLGRQVTVNQGLGRTVTGKAVDLDQDGSLWLETADGNRVRVFSGEIIEAHEA